MSDREIRHGLDTLDWYIATLHQLMGHRATANYLGMPVVEGEQADCILCRYENGTATKDQVVAQMGTSEKETP